jgi:hypothetical protein
VPTMVSPKNIRPPPNNTPRNGLGERDWAIANPAIPNRNRVNRRYRHRPLSHGPAG